MRLINETFLEEAAIMKGFTSSKEAVKFIMARYGALYKPKVNVGFRSKIQSIYTKVFPEYAQELKHDLQSGGWRVNVELSTGSTMTFEHPRSAIRISIDKKEKPIPVSSADEIMFAVRVSVDAPITHYKE